MSTFMAVFSLIGFFYFCFWVGEYIRICIRKHYLRKYKNLRLLLKQERRLREYIDKRRDYYYDQWNRLHRESRLDSERYEKTIRELGETIRMQKDRIQSLEGLFVNIPKKPSGKNKRK